ncbi:MAG: hypothetical protein JXA25_01815 [Anaerolineales bacterium]|nr:hypothetical protein [Anaerolineales bacterium]
MKKIAIGMVIAVTAVLVITASPVYADRATPPERPGRMGGSAQGGSRMMGAGGQDLDAAAEALGMTVEELQAQLDAGATVHDLLESAGVDLSEWTLEYQYLYNYSVDRQAFLAEQLGMTVEELQAALEDGSTVHDLAEAAGIEVPMWGEDWMNGSRNGTGSAGTGIGDRMPELLGMTAEELEAEIAAGNTIHDLFESAGLEFPAGGSMSGSRGNRGGR